MRRLAKRLSSAALALATIAALSTHQTVAASAAQRPQESPDLLATGFKNLLALRPDQAIGCFTPLVLHAAKQPFKRHSNAVLTARYLVLVGRAFSCDQNFAASSQVYSLAHHLDPDNQFATIYLADNLSRAGRDAEARTVYELVKKLASKNALADVYLSIDSFKSGEYKQAVQHAQDGLKKTGGQNNWYSHAILARAYARYGLKQESIDECHIAAKLAPTPYHARLLEALGLAWGTKPLKSNSEVQSLYRAAGKVLPDDPLWQTDLGLSLGLVHGKEAEQAKYLEKAVNEKRLEYKSFASFSEYLQNHKRVDDAWRCAQYLTALTPSYYDCYALQAAILQAQNRTAEARQNLEKALLLGPHVSACYIQLATLLWKENEKKAAVDTLERCVKIMPECSAAWQQLAEYYVDAKEFPAAQHAIKAALAGMPPLQESHRLTLIASHQMSLLSAGLGAIAYRNNDLPMALKQAELFNQLKFIPDLPDYLKVIKLRPGRIEPDKLLAKEREAAQHAELADMLYQTRQMADCIKEYRKAIELNPDDLDLQEYLFNATAESGNWMDSIGQDWTLSNKLISKGVKALSEINKKKPAESGEK